MINYRTTGIVLLITMVALNIARSLMEIKVPFTLSISIGLLGLLALGIDSYHRNRLKSFGFRISVFLLALAIVAALQYFVMS